MWERDLRDRHIDGLEAGGFGLEFDRVAEGGGGRERRLEFNRDLEGGLRESALLRVSMSWRNLASPEDEFAAEEAEVVFPERGFPAMAGNGEWDPLTVERNFDFDFRRVSRIGVG